MTKGVVRFLNEKPWTGNGKSLTFRSFKLDGDQLYYRIGAKPFPAGLVVGAQVEFDGKPNPDGKSVEVDIASIKVSAAAPEPTPVSAKAGTGTDWAAKDASIQYQSSRKDAIEFVKLLVSTEAIKLPAKQADKLAAIEALVDGYTVQFLDDIGSKGAYSRVLGEETKAEEPVTEPDDE